eukprot:jgi/Mesvir1/14497/Mv26238-RA.1
MAHAGATFEDLPSEILYVLAELSWPYLRGVNKASHKEWEAVLAIMEAKVRAVRNLIDEELEFRDANPYWWFVDIKKVTPRRLYEMTPDQLRAIYDKVSVPRLREAEGYLYTTRADRLEQMDHAYTDFVEVINRTVKVPVGPRTKAARDAYFASIPDVDRENVMERRVDELVTVLCAGLVADDTEANGGVPTGLADLLIDIFNDYKHRMISRIFTHPSYNRVMP